MNFIQWIGPLVTASSAPHLLHQTLDERFPAPFGRPERCLHLGQAIGSAMKSMIMR